MKDIEVNQFIEQAEVTTVEKLIRCRKINELHSTNESMWYAIKLQQRILQLMFDNRNKFWDDLVKEAVQTYHTLCRKYYTMTFEYHSFKQLILIADNDFEMRHLLQRLLNEEQYITISTQHGHEIFKLVRYQPSLIILDVYRSLHSIDVCRRLRNLKTYSKYRDIPIILFTSSLSKKNQKKMKELGKIDWIAKPARMSDLLEQIKIRLPLKIMEMTI